MKAARRVVSWTPVERAWLAGLLDGAGWVGVRRSRSNPRTLRWAYTAGIVVAQTDGVVVDYFHWLLGGAGRRFRVPTAAPNKLIHEVRVGARADVVAILEAVLPLLVTKAGQAEGVLAFRRVIDDKTLSVPERDRRAAALFGALRAAKAAIPVGRPRPAGPPGDPADAAWLAALIDGKGHVGIEHQKGGRVHILTITVVHTDLVLLRRMQAVAGCGDIAGRPRAKLHYTPAYRWRVAGASARRVLEQAGPYLIQKKRHLAVALRFQRTIHTGADRWAAVQEHEYRIREECHLALRALNAKRRGRGSTPS